MSQLKSEALVLKSMNWRDTSEVVSLFTREVGRVDVIAKGSRTSKSQFMGILETLNRIETFIYISPTRSLQKMGQSYILETYPKIRQDLECLSYAMGMLELVYFFFKEGESDSVFFDFLIDLFRQLDESQNYLIVFWFFLLKLCSYLGFKPDFERCFKCGKLITTNTVCFLVSEGSPACKSCNTNNTDIFVISKEEADFLKMLQSSNFRKISKIQKTENIRSNIVQFLLNFLRYHTDEKLNLSSITFFKQQ